MELLLRHVDGTDTSGQPCINLVGFAGSAPDQPVFTATLSHYEPELTPRFAMFEVTRTVLEWVFVSKPQTVTVDRLCADSADVVRLLAALGVGVSVTEPLDASRLYDGADLTHQRWFASIQQLLPCAFDPEGTLARLVAGEQSLGYELYALSARNHNLLIRWAERVLPYFTGREAVLDLGCGTGVFLDQLARLSIPAIGVDNNEPSVRYARSLGLNVTERGGAEFLRASPGQFDAIHCSHLVEHLEWQSLTDTMALIAGALKPGGIAVLVFPDPESIRSQLLGFWRDPDHKRFYHPDVISMLGRTFGLIETHNSQREIDRSIAPFSLSPPDTIPLPAAGGDEDLQTTLSRINGRLDQQEQWIRQLWAVNQTWAWADDALLVLTKQ